MREPVMPSKIKILPIDFSRPWWTLITDQFWLALGVSISAALRDIFWVFTPFMITSLLELHSWYWFAVFCGLWVIFLINLVFFHRMNARFQLQAIHSVFDNAYRYLLNVDPLYHTKRVSGAVVAKIERAARGYEEVLDQITYSFVPLGISICTMLAILCSYSPLLTLAICICLASMVGYAYYFVYYACCRWENAFIASDDAFKSVAFENLAQTPLIRATFATDYAQARLDGYVAQNCVTEKHLWDAYAQVSRILNTLYGLSIVVLAGFFMHLIQHQLVPLTQAISIILAYINCTFQLIKILQPLRRYMRGMAAIKDLFAFMPQFGKQTVPTINHQPQTVDKVHNLAIQAADISFHYDGTQLFNHLTLNLHCTSTQQNKLYGLIGPSGVGKTTLLNILGGQLKPTAGTIYINDIDIYAVGDATRRQLIVLQGQMASSMKGTVRYNLLFGLPEQHGYADTYLNDILARIGLKQIFDALDGLDTSLGEGAVNISGGQRQRLNFAALYLRAKFYCPVVVLIDEPTSSLDEVSELAITAMIAELATSAITLVIAHRLKTLEHAAGLIDVSLATQNTALQPYSTDELKLHSAYYRRLLHGIDTLE
jgi:ABC-type multidrug transport system fused ATPase/permease subunit